MHVFPSKKLINWQIKHGRNNLPWQGKGCYETWISEIMLQQTQVKTVIPYYQKFLKHYPTVEKLSKAQINKVMSLWAGLGYYRRASYIYEASKMIARDYQNVFPTNYEHIIKLPGIGRSTAGAILSLSLNKKFPILDGNVKRVIKRFFNLKGDTKEKDLWEISSNILPESNFKKFNQALMDLGSGICGKKPQCDKCPIHKDCSYEYLEEKKVKNNNDFKEKKLYMLYVTQQNRSKKVLMCKNKKSNIWKNLFLFPTFNKFSDLKNFIKEELKIDYNNISRGTISHRLSHIKMNISFYEVCVKETNYLQYQWLSYKKDMAVPKPVQDFLNKQYREIK